MYAYVCIRYFLIPKIPTSRVAQKSTQIRVHTNLTIFQVSVYKLYLGKKDCINFIPENCEKCIKACKACYTLCERNDYVLRPHGIGPK